jgi:transposase
VLGGKGSRSRANPGRALASCAPFSPSVIATGGSAGNQFRSSVVRRTMKNEENLMEVHVIGIDVGKTLFHLVRVDAVGKVVIRKRCSRTQLLTFTANIRVRHIGMEACSGARFLARALQQQGHEVKLMPAQYVKPYVKTNKSDYIDAEAIADAVQRPSMRFVPLKTEEHLDLQDVHRVRERWVMRRTAVINQIRGLLLERGITLPKGRSHLEEGLPEILA